MNFSCLARPFTGLIALLLLLSPLLPPSLQAQPDVSLTLRSRVRSRSKSSDGPAFQEREKQAHWNPHQTAIIICDMWDDHWCRSAARRVVEMAGPMNEVIKTARNQGIFIIHAPSSVVAFYENTPQRQLALKAPFAKTPKPLATSGRWGTAWCWPDPDNEGALPIDDSDMGCDCPQKCMIREAWTRQISTLEIDAADAITDNGQETYNLLQARGIKNVILMGVHLNMCVLGRPFGIRQMVRMGKNVVLMRDLTDTMYDPRQYPQVSHFRGTELMVEHVEKYWCPTVTSAALTGKAPFRFRQTP